MRHKILGFVWEYCFGILFGTLTLVLWLIAIGEDSIRFGALVKDGTLGASLQNGGTILFHIGLDLVAAIVFAAIIGAVFKFLVVAPIIWLLGCFSGEYFPKGAK